MNKKNDLCILNLSGELTETLFNYFEKSSIKIVTQDAVRGFETIDYILVQTEVEAKQVSKDYACEINDIQIICLGAVREIKDFLLHHGRLIIEQEFVESKLGEFILHKFFKKNYNIHLDESYSTIFLNPKEFKITNHLSMGLHIDELSAFAFENGFNIIALRSFMDHALYYFTYLKQAGLAGIPYEIEYDKDDQFFVVNIHCPVRNFVAEYMVDSFGSVNSKDPLQYLLGVVARSTDFLEVTYIEDPGRLVFTAVWARNDKIKLTGLSFNNVLTTAQTVAQLDRKIANYIDIEENFQIHENRIQEQSPKSLPGSILEMVINNDENSIMTRQPELATNIIAFVIAKFDESNSDRSIGDVDEEEFKLLLKDHPDVEEIVKLSSEDLEELLERVHKNHMTQAYEEEIQRVRSALEDEDHLKKNLQETLAEEVSRKVTGHINAEVLNKILGSKNEKETAQIVGGSKEDVDDFVVKFSTAQQIGQREIFTRHLGDALASQKDLFNVKSSSPTISLALKKALAVAGKKLGIDDKIQTFLQMSATQKIEEGLKDFADSLGVSYDELSESHLEKFKTIQLPKIIQKVFEDSDALEGFKRELEKGFDLNQRDLFVQSSRAFEIKFKKNIEEKLQGLADVQKVDEKYIITNEKIRDEKMQLLIHNTLQETLHEEFKLEKANKSEIERKEKEIIENLCQTLNLGKNEVIRLIKGATQKVKDQEVKHIVDNIFQTKPGEQDIIIVNDEIYEQQNDEVGPTSSKISLTSKNSSLKEAELIKKLKSEQLDKKKLESRLRDLEKQLASESGAHLHSSEIHPRSEDLIKATPAQQQKILEYSNKFESQLKVMRIEASKQEALFASEVKKYEKILKGKNIIIEKAKESMKAIVNRKEQKIQFLTNQLNDLNTKLNSSDITELKTQLNKLTQDNEQLHKTSEMYKNKISDIINLQNATSQSDSLSDLNQENRKLKSLNEQLENKLYSMSRENKSLADRYNEMNDLQAKYRTENINHVASFKDMELKLKQSKESQNKLNLALAKANAAVQAAQNNKELELVKNQNLQLQAKIRELGEKNAGGNNNTGASTSNSSQTAKEKHLEKSTRLLQAEISKIRSELENSKKEAIKLRAESTALQNKVKSLEREIKKYKRNSSKKSAA